MDERDLLAWHVESASSSPTVRSTCHRLEACLVFPTDMGVGFLSGNDPGSTERRTETGLVLPYPGSLG